MANDSGIAKAKVGVGVHTGIKEVISWSPKWVISRYDSEFYDVVCKPLAAKASALLVKAQQAFLEKDFKKEHELRAEAEKIIDILHEKGETSVIEGNLLLTEGVTLMWTLICGGTGTPFDNTNAYIGVGDSTTTASDDQTGLLGTNTAYQGMETGYPSTSGKTTTWRAVFDGSTANFDWREFTVANGSDNSAVNMNRVVDDQGTKASGQTWTCDLQITLN